MKKYIPRIFNIAVISTLAVSPLLWKSNWLNSWGILLLFLCLIFICMKPGCYMDILHSRRLRTCQNGVELIYLFLSSCVLAGGFWLATFAGWTLPQVKTEAGLATLAGSGGSSDSGGSRGILERDSTDLPVFGADRDKMASYRYRLRYDSGGASHRPGQVGKTGSREVQFENEKIVLDENRAADQVCATKYRF